jgi:hypothetical protein
VAPDQHLFIRHLQSKIRKLCLMYLLWRCQLSQLLLVACRANRLTSNPWSTFSRMNQER